jgi:arylsulfatase A
LNTGPLNGGKVPTAGPGLPDWDSSKVGATLVEKAIGFMDDLLAKNKADGKDRPFFIHFCTDGAHGPYTPPDNLLGTPLKGVTKMTPHTDMVHEVDVITGKLVEALQARGLLANTLVLVTSDNGGIPADRSYGHDAVGGLRGSKSHIWEGGHRVPFVVRWGDGTPQGSKIPPGSVRNQVIGAHDIVPTMAELAGATLGPDQALDSVSLVPALLGRRGDDQPVRQTLLVQSSPGRDAFSEAVDAQGNYKPDQAKTAAANTAPAKGKKAKKQQLRAAAEQGADTGSDGMAHALREGPWKLTFNIANQPAALFNLANDLTEKKNLIDDPTQADRVKRMTQLYHEMRQSKRSTPALK